MTKCEICKHAIVSTSLSGHHVACKINANQPVTKNHRIFETEQFCEFFNDISGLEILGDEGQAYERRSGLKAYEKKHEFFAEEEFRV